MPASRRCFRNCSLNACQRRNDFSGNCLVSFTLAANCSPRTKLAGFSLDLSPPYGEGFAADLLLDPRRLICSESNFAVAPLAVAAHGRQQHPAAENVRFGQT